MSKHQEPGIPSQIAGIELGPRQRAAETKRLRTRSALLTAANTLFQEPGYMATKMEDVAELAGISVASAFNYYSKGELATTIVDTGFVLTGSAEEYLARDQDFFVAERILAKTIDPYPDLRSAVLLRLVDGPEPHNYTGWFPKTHETLPAIAGENLKNEKIAETFNIRDPEHMATLAIAGALIHPLLGDLAVEDSIYMTDRIIRPGHKPYPHDQLTSSL